MNKESFLKRLEGIHDLPTLPQVALEINRLLDDPQVTVEQVAETIEKDQAIVPKLLRLVNSSFFGFQEKVGDVNRAVVILGFNTVRNAIFSVSVIDSIKGIQSDRLDFSEFWRHAISCAVISKHLAINSGLNSYGDAFTAGLVHDIGKLVLAKFFPNEFISIMEKVESGSSFYVAESEVLPMHQNQIGAYIAKRWHLPSVLCRAIEYSKGVHDFSNAPIAYIVSIAEIMLDSIEGENLSTTQKDFLPSDVAEKLWALIENKEEWMPDILDEIEQAYSVLMGEQGNGE